MMHKLLKTTDALKLLLLCIRIIHKCFKQRVTFLEEAPCALQGCIYLTYSDIVKYYYNLEGLFSVLNIWNVIYSCGCEV